MLTSCLMHSGFWGDLLHFADARSRHGLHPDHKVAEQTGGIDPFIVKETIVVLPFQEYGVIPDVSAEWLQQVRRHGPR